jgi:hypothetical protein
MHPERLILRIRSEACTAEPTTIDGYEEPLIYQGSITQVIFEDWMENKILQICNPWPGPRSIIVMDNCSIHRS